VHDVTELAAWVAPTLRVVAVDGLFLPGAPTRSYVVRARAALVVALCSLLGLSVVLTAGGRGHVWWAYAIAGGIAGFIGGAVTSRLTTDRLVVSALCGTALGAVVAGAVAQSVNHLSGRSVAVVALCAAALSACCVVVALWSISRRGAAVVDGLRRQFARPGRPDPELRQIDSTVNHVYCTTDLESGQALFFAPRFAYGFRHGLADMQHNPLTVAAVTQASAAVPPGFPPVALEVVGFQRSPGHSTDDAVASRDRHQQVKLSDGGVYDNLGDEWEVGFENRARLFPHLTTIQQPANVLLVADASRRFGWQPFSTSGFVAREVRALSRNLDIQHAATTTRRRHDLYQQFRSTRREAGEHRGALVMIDDSPVDVCTAASSSNDPELNGRAERALEFLSGRRSADEWRQLSDRCSHVPTTLGPLTTPVTLDLLELAFTSTMVELFVYLDLGELRAFPREVFERQLA
jgi:uncharacterized membrane protein YeaQ/YmgE (transglycosylase-associated protein family)